MCGEACVDERHGFIGQKALHLNLCLIPRHQCRVGDVFAMIVGTNGEAFIQVISCLRKAVTRHTVVLRLREYIYRPELAIWPNDCERREAAQRV